LGHIFGTIKGRKESNCKTVLKHRTAKLSDDQGCVFKAECSRPKASSLSFYSYHHPITGLKRSIGPTISEGESAGVSITQRESDIRCHKFKRLVSHFHPWSSAFSSRIVYNCNVHIDAFLLPKTCQSSVKMPKLHCCLGVSMPRWEHLQ
jgi:hypothetical protein